MPRPVEVKTLIEALERTRVGYRKEMALHKFLMDGYAGSGGFSGSIRMESSSWWGAAADIYAGTVTATLDIKDVEERGIDTYLDRFPREDMPKFKRRVAVAHYPNFVEAIADTILDYFHRKPPSYEVPKQVEEWMKDVDGSGESFQSIMEDVVHLRAAVLGWTPVMLDLPTVPDGIDTEELSVAQAEEMKLVQRLIPLFPAHLLDYALDDKGKLSWAKVCIDEVVQSDPFAKPSVVKAYYIWTKTTVEVFRVAQRNGKGEKGLEGETVERPHNYGAVPIVIVRGKPAPDDKVKGRSLTYSVTVEAKRLFNLHSELDEHIRQSTFAILQVPTTDPEKVGEIVTGGGNALPVHPDWNIGYEWLSPDTATAAVLETRIDNTKKDMYRMAKQEFTAGSKGDGGGAATSGLAHAFQFEGTNRTIAKFAESMASGEQMLLRLSGKGLPQAVKDENEIRVTPATKFNVEELLSEIREAMEALDLDLGMTAGTELKKRLVRKVLPNLDENVLRLIDSEIEGREKARIQAQALAADALRAAGEGGTKDDNTEDEDNDEDKDDPDEE